LLVIAPHADDETLGAGGTIHRASRQGWDVEVAVARLEAPNRWLELEEACRVLGARPRVLDPDWADQWLDSLPLALVVTAIEDVLDEVRPDVVIIPDIIEIHQEHRVVAEASMAALRPSAGTSRWRPPIVLAFEHLADAWALQQPVYPPSTWARLAEDDLDAKLKAMKAHASQMRPHPSERSVESIDALARVRGAQAGCGAAECFSVIRWLL
jgi:N-acetylglucosamine malate deacetylase 1